MWYYIKKITHSLGPIMWATGAVPEKVTAFSVFAPPPDNAPSFSNVGDIASFIMTKNNDGSVFKFSASTNFGAAGNSYRVIGEKGQVENVRGRENKIMLRYNPWDIPSGAKEINFYLPKWGDKDINKIVKGGHGGSDYLTARYFLQCLEKGVQPEFPFDINSAVNMSSVAILAHRSALEGGKTFDIPDFNKQECIDLYKNDTATPFWKGDVPPTIPCCTHIDYAPTKEQIKLQQELIDKK